MSDNLPEVNMAAGEPDYHTIHGSRRRTIMGYRLDLASQANE